MSSGSQTATTQQTNQTPTWLAQGQQYGAQQAKALYQSQSPAYYPGSTVANQSPMTQAANQGITARAINGSPTNAAASGYLQNVLGPNFAMQQNANQGALNKSISDAVIPQVESQFSAGGRYGSPSMGAALTTSLADAIAPQMYGQYQANQQLQQGAAGMAPNQANQDWNDLGQLQQAGSAQDQYAQNQVNANVAHWNYNQNLDQNKLAQYMQLLNSANVPTNSTTTQSQPGGGIMGLLGGVLGGLL
jgi:hypothetical protein